jgi:hypothetical protein
MNSLLRVSFQVLWCYCGASWDSGEVAWNESEESLR